MIPEAMNGQLVRHGEILSKDSRYITNIVKLIVYLLKF